MFNPAPELVWQAAPYLRARHCPHAAHPSGTAAIQQQQGSSAWAAALARLHEYGPPKLKNSRARGWGEVKVVARRQFTYKVQLIQVYL